MKDKEQLIEQLIEQMDKVFFYCVKRCNSRTNAEHLKMKLVLADIHIWNIKANMKT